MIDAAHLDIRRRCARRAGARRLAVDVNRLGDRRRLPNQARNVETMALVDALGPRRLHGPVQLARNAVEKPLNPCGRRVRFAAQANAQSVALISMAEPGLLAAAGEQRNDDREITSETAEDAGAPWPARRSTSLDHVVQSDPAES